MSTSPDSSGLWGPLEPFKVIYAVEPNVPAEAQERPAEWVTRGGVLVTTSRAASLGRYNEPATVLDEVRGVLEAPRDRLVLADLQSAAHVGSVNGDFGAFGARGTLEVKEADVIGQFGDGTPAVALLNWTNEPQEAMALKVRTERPVASVRSVKLGRVRFRSGEDFIELKMPLDTVDVLMVTYK